MITSIDAARGTADAIVHLTRYNTTSSALSLAEITRSAWATATSGPATPVDLASRGLRWWAAILDRREPRWHLPHEIVFSTPFAHLRDFSQACTDDVVPTLVLPPQCRPLLHGRRLLPRAEPALPGAGGARRGNMPGRAVLG